MDDIDRRAFREQLETLHEVLRPVQTRLQVSEQTIITEQKICAEASRELEVMALILNRLDRANVNRTESDTLQLQTDVKLLQNDVEKYQQLIVRIGQAAPPSAPPSAPRFFEPLPAPDTSNGQITCGVSGCSKTYKSEHDFLAHVLKKHDAALQCRLCIGPRSPRYQSMGNVQKHMRANHSVDVKNLKLDAVAIQKV